MYKQIKRKNLRQTKFDHLYSAQYLVYDLSILQLDLRIEKAKSFTSAEKAAGHLGCTVKTLLNNSEPGKRIKGIDKKLYAVRPVTIHYQGKFTTFKKDLFP